MLAITLLTTDDLVAAKVAFTPHEAGLYGGASLIGRVILYLPVAIVTVLLPSVSARVSAGHSTRSLLTNSLLATGAVCVVVHHLLHRLPAPDRPDRVRREVPGSGLAALDVRDRDVALLAPERRARVPPRAPRDPNVLAPARRRGSPGGPLRGVPFLAARAARREHRASRRYFSRSRPASHSELRLRSTRYELRLAARHGGELRGGPALLQRCHSRLVPRLVLHPNSRMACCIGDGTSSIRDYLIGHRAASEHADVHARLRINGAPEGTDRAPADPDRERRSPDPCSCPC